MHVCIVGAASFGSYLCFVDSGTKFFRHSVILKMKLASMHRSISTLMAMHFLEQSDFRFVAP